MRLKTFHAESLSAAMELVRETLGPDAIIVATHEDDANRGARITAAIDPPDQEFDFFSEGASEETLEYLTEVLERHGVPNGLVDKLIDAAGDAQEQDAKAVLEEALTRVFTFEAIPDGPGDKPIMLIGPPGVGKTVSCVKLAAHAALQSGDDDPPPVNFIAADPVRIGARAQLAAYADALEASVYDAEDGAALATVLTKLRRNEMVIIDTPGTNPYDLEEMAHLVELSEAGRPKTLLVLTAGRDAEEAAELAQAFRPAGASVLVTTGLDLARRLGAVLSAADAAGLAIGDVSVAPQIGKGFQPLDANRLARLLLPPEDQQGETAR